MSGEPLLSPQEASLPRSAALAVPWDRVALGAILLLAAVLDLIKLDRIGLGNTYYAAAVRSMLTGWYNFFFVSLDPGGFVSVDKPPLGFWIQAASARLFGFSGPSLLLPQVLAGILSVALLYVLVAHGFGRVAGLLAALALALTPVAVLVNRSNLVESTLVLTVLLAAWAVTGAAERGRLSWLLLGAVLLGLGFNVKMLEAYLVLPALALLYLLGAPVRWSTRIGRLALAGVVLLAVSLSWVTAVDLTPAGQRPYVGSSGDNSELSLALGYNGLGRVTGNVFSFLPGRTTVSQTISDPSPAGLGFTRGETGAPGIQRLVNPQLGGQASWLLGLAVIGFLVAAWQRRARFPLDRQQQALVLWGTWLLTAGAFFSIAGFFHGYYLAMIAPPVAALAGIGSVTLWQEYRRPGGRGWELPLALLVGAAVQAHILSFFLAWSHWLTPIVVGASLLLAIALAALRLNGGLDRRLTLTATGLGLLALLLAPSVWTAYTVANATGTAVPSAGPAARSGDRPFGVGPGDAAANPAGPNLIRYLKAQQGHTTFLVATLSAHQAEPIILATGRPVMDLGGFLGTDRILDPPRLAARVAAGQVRYFLLPGGGRLTPEMRRYLERRSAGLPVIRNENVDLITWVSRHCRPVPASAYHAAVSFRHGVGPGALDLQQLYDCG